MRGRLVSGIILIVGFWGGKVILEPNPTYHWERGRPHPQTLWQARASCFDRSLFDQYSRFALTAGEGARVPSMKNRRIVIVGFMGCGKTTVAKTLALQLGCNVIDLDSFITEREGPAPADIIAQDGEPSFRKIETQALGDALENGDPRVISLGGGAWTVEANRALVAQHECLSVWLDAPFELC